MQGPKLLLCDEPIASLDPSSSKTIMDLLRSMTQKRNIACIVNLHQLDVALRYSTRIIGLSKGEIVFDGPPQQLDDETIQRIYGTSRENLMLGGKEHGLSARLSSPTPSSGCLWPSRKNITNRRSPLWMLVP